jgi:hypothetical protein
LIFLDFLSNWFDSDADVNWTPSLWLGVVLVASVLFLERIYTTCKRVINQRAGTEGFEPVSSTEDPELAMGSSSSSSSSSKPRSSNANSAAQYSITDDDDRGTGSVNFDSDDDLDMIGMDGDDGIPLDHKKSKSKNATTSSGRPVGKSSSIAMTALSGAKAVVAGSSGATKTFKFGSAPAAGKTNRP